MRRILDFFIGNTVRLLFWFYILLAVGLSMGNQLYFTSGFLNTSNSLSGGVHHFFNGLSSYFGLASENEFLQQQNKLLQERLVNVSYVSDSMNTPKKKFGYITGQIIRNSYTAKDNYLTLSLGTEQGVSQDMGVVNEKGIVGIITHSGANFSRVQSVLNSHSRINAKIKGSDFFGGLVWNGRSPNQAQLIDVPNLAPISIGDTIVTGGMSIIFPDQLPIGTIENFELTEAQDDYLINVNLFNNMQNIGRVYVIQNQLKKDIESIENLSNE